MTPEEYELAKLGGMLAGEAKRINKDSMSGKPLIQPLDIRRIINDVKTSPNHNNTEINIPSNTSSKVVRVEGVDVEVPTSINLIPTPEGVQNPTTPRIASSTESHTPSGEYPHPSQVMAQIVEGQLQIVEQLKILNEYMRKFTAPTDLSAFGLPIAKDTDEPSIQSE